MNDEEEEEEKLKITSTYAFTVSDFEAVRSLFFSTKTLKKSLVCHSK
jgi:hypothetical protein